MMRVVILSVALVSGGAASYLSVGTDRSATETNTENIIDMDEILVVTRDLKIGDTIQTKDLSWQGWPSNNTVPGLILRSSAPQALDDYIGTTAKAQFYAGEPARIEKLSGGSNLLSLTLPHGKRAISVKLTTGNTARGFITTNDRVDVIHTSLSRDQKERSISRTVLSNIRVLAIDEAGQDSSGAAKTATLELDPGQVEVISAAEASGLISLALRPLSETTDTAIPVTAKSHTIQMIKSGKVVVIQQRSGG